MDNTVLIIIAIAVMLFVWEKFFRPKNEGPEDPNLPGPEEPEEEESEIYSNRDLKQLSDTQLLARTLWGEARGTSGNEKYMVAQVIINRKESGQYPDTIQNVILAPYQFSCWNNNWETKTDNQYKVRLKNLPEEYPYTYENCYQVAKDVVNGSYAKRLPDYVYHYHLYTDNIKIENYRVVEGPVAWMEGMKVAKFADHIYLYS